jgi:hypothetical protein
VWELRGSMTEEAVETANLGVPWFRSGILAVACFFFLFGAVNAQTLQGSVQSNSASGTDIYSLYAGEDPLGGKPEVAPTSIGPKGNICIAPDPKWQLVTQIGNLCYWYAPFPKRLAGYVVPMSKISWVESGGGRCGVNPFSNPNDPNGTAICNQPPPAKNPYAPKDNAGKSPDPSMPRKSGCETQGTFIPHCYYTDSSGKPTSNPNGNTGPYCFYQDDFGHRTNPPALCVIRAYPRSTTPTPLPWEQPAQAADQRPCGLTLDKENEIHAQVMKQLALELSHEPANSTWITGRMTKEDSVHDSCVGQLKSATAQATPASKPIRKYIKGNYKRQSDGSYWFTDTLGGHWKADAQFTSASGIEYKIDLDSFRLKYLGGNFYQGYALYNGKNLKIEAKEAKLLNP